MADEQYRWLDRETAERLLSGEPLEAVDAAARNEVQELAKTLGALSAPHPLTGAELPGEAAALAAFRKRRAERGDAAAAVGPHRARAAADAGLFRLDRRAVRDRRRWGPPARLGLAAALAVGMAGGVAVAAGLTGLPTPFRGNDPEPASSVSVAETPDAPSASQSPDASGTADGALGVAGTGRDEARGDGRDSASGDGERDAAAARRARRIISACRDMRDGKELSADRERILENAAGGTTNVWKYCKGVLAAAGGTERKAGEQDNGEDGSGKGGRDDRKGSDDGDEGEGGGRTDDDSGILRGGDRRTVGAALPPEPSLPSRPALPADSELPTVPTASAVPTVTAAPSASAVPTVTAAPSASAVPTVTAAPSASAVPTSTTVPTESP